MSRNNKQMRAGPAPAASSCVEQGQESEATDDRMEVWSRSQGYSGATVELLQEVMHVLMCFW